MKQSSREEHDQITEAYERAIGKIVIAWNDYQECLGQLFANLFGRRQWSLALSAWHAIENDRAQRNMLRAVARTRLKPSNPLLTEAEWLINQSNHIADQRNTGIHMPLMKYHGLNGDFHMLPLAIFGDQKAIKMSGRDLLKEYAHYERQIRKMLGYAIAIDFALTPPHSRRGSAKLPERPKLTGFATATGVD